MVPRDSKGVRCFTGNIKSEREKKRQQKKREGDTSPFKFLNPNERKVGERGFHGEKKNRR